MKIIDITSQIVLNFDFSCIPLF